MTDSEPTSPDDEGLAQAFEETQTRLATWQKTYDQLHQAQRNLSQAQKQGLESEFKQLREKLQEIELDLALTLLFNLGDAAKEYWQDILRQESFWNFLRFAGLGFVLGLVVKSLIG